MNALRFLGALLLGLLLVAGSLALGLFLLLEGNPEAQAALWEAVRARPMVPLFTGLLLLGALSLLLYPPFLGYLALTRALGQESEVLLAHPGHRLTPGGLGSCATWPGSSTGWRRKRRGWSKGLRRRRPRPRTWWRRSGSASPGSWPSSPRGGALGRAGARPPLQPQGPGPSGGGARGGEKPLRPPGPVPPPPRPVPAPGRLPGPGPQGGLCA